MTHQSTTTKKGRKVNYVDGVSMSMTKKIAKFYFGDKFLSIQHDIANENFLVIVDNRADEYQIKYFKDFWKVNIRRAE